MGRARRRFSAEFKCKVALAAIKGERTLPLPGLVHRLVLFEIGQFDRPPVSGGGDITAMMLHETLHQVGRDADVSAAISTA